MTAFGGDNNRFPSLEAGGGSSDPGGRFVLREVRSWALLPLLFAVLLPWTWVYFAFAHDLRTNLPFLGLVVTHVGLGLIWLGRRRRSRGLTWAGAGCYPLAVALCLLLQDVI